MKNGSLSAGAAKLDRFAAAVVLILMLLAMLYLTAAAFMETTHITTEIESGELVEIYADNIFLNLIVLALLLAVFYLFYRHFRSVNLRDLEIVLMVWTLILGLAFILSVKLSAPWYSDSFLVTYAAQRAAEGDMSAIDAYFVRYPYQLGFVLYEEAFFRLMSGILPGMPDGYYCLALQGVNLLLVMLSYHALIRIATLLFSNPRVGNMTAVMLMFCLPAVLSSTFLYGNIPAFACGTVAVWLYVAFTSERKLIDGLLCALFIGLAVALKLNLYIFFIALALLWLLDLLRSFSVKSLLCLALVVISVFSFSKLPQELYERRSGKSFGQGIPLVAWLAMGFSEGHAGPGWYDEEYTVNAFKEYGADREATAENAKEALSQRTEYFSQNPGEALSFFSVKLKSMWNEPSYESLWINQVQSSYGEKAGLYNLFCDGGEKRTLGFMNQYQQLVFLGVLLSLIQLWKGRNTRSCILLVIILGGMLYHLLFEAKSQYCLSYFMLMVPMAASGVSSLFHGVEYR